MTIRLLLSNALHSAMIRTIVEDRLEAIFHEHKNLPADGLETALCHIVHEIVGETIRDLGKL